MTKKSIPALALLLLLSTSLPWAEEEEGPGFLGVNLAIVENVDVGKEENGVYVDSVIPGSGAEAAGLQQNDRIVALDGAAVENFDDLHGALERTRPNDPVTVTLSRDGAERTVTAVLGRRPVKHGKRWGVVLGDKRAFLGVHLQELNPQLARYFEVEGGLLITEVVEDGPAMEAGVQAGDVLLEIDHQPVRDRGVLHELLEEVEPGDEISARLQRRGRPLTLYVKAGEHEQLPATIDLRLLHHYQYSQQLHEISEDGTSEATVEIVVPYVVVGKPVDPTEDDTED